MKKLIALRFLFCSVIFIAFFTFATPRSLASHKVFQENFNSNTEGAFPNGWKLANGSSGSCKATWKIKNGMAGIKITNEPTCATNIMPEDGIWNDLGNNYIFELDMKFVNGVDHNIAFRFTNSSKWYDIHFQSPGNFVLERVPPVPPGGVTLTYPTPNREEPYHLKITVQTGRITMSIDNVEVLDYSYNPTAELEPTGRIALRAGVGANPSSETYFDNIVVTNIDTALDIPLLKQTSDPWQEDEYDSAATWATPSASTINRWGCAMTSAVMLLKYHGITKLPDETILDPGTLNSWLKNQEDGYIGEGAVNWYAISRLTKLAKSINNITAFDALEFTRKGNDKTELSSTIDKGQPVILQVPKHFILAKGINGDTFDINDPYYDHLTLKDGYDNNFLSMRQLTPSFTNLSYIVVAVDSDISAFITNSSGKKIGSNGTETFNEISNANYYLEEGIQDPTSGKSTKEIRILDVQKPTDDIYTLTIATTSTTTKQYSLKLYRYTTDGAVTVVPLSGKTKNDEPATFSLSYKQNGEGNQTTPTDTTPPQIKSTKTLDTNNNGKIDTIEVTFVRDIHGASVNSTGTDFTVDGYDIKKAKETSPGIVQITLDEKPTNDSGTIPIVTLKNNNIKDITSDTYNHQQTATPIDGIPPIKPTVDIPGDKYLLPQKVTLNSLDTPNTPTIYYTLDESDPATSSARLVYSLPITINDSSITLKAIAGDSAGNTSEVMTETYEIAPKIEDASIAVATSSSTGFTITWTTDRPSYSRLVFGTNSKKVKGTDTKYGYDKTTNETSIKQTTHTVTLAGLIPGTTYYYRLISRGSPEQVTDERSITLASDPTPTPTQTPTPSPTPTPTPASSSSSSSSSSNTSSNSSSAACNDEKPQSAPTLTSTFAGINTVALSWQEAKDPVSYYLVAYGTEPGKLQYGNPNVGGKGTTSFVVENLSGGQTYYFRVRGGNGCTPGDYSNEISATPIGFSQSKPATGFEENVLGAKTLAKTEKTAKKAFVKEVKSATLSPTPPINYQTKNTVKALAIFLALSGVAAGGVFLKIRKI